MFSDQDSVQKLEEPSKRLSRRTLLRWILGTGAFGAIGAIALSAISIRPLERQSKEQEPVAAGDRLIFAAGVSQGQTIKTENLQVNEATLALPEGKKRNQDNLIMLCHLDPSKLAPPTILDWTVEGFIAYSSICTHLGCSTYFSPNTEATPLPHLLCPCHGGIFDPQSGALVKAGPPPRRLPQLPIKINDNGELIAAGWFNEPPGVISKSELKRWRQKHKS